MKVQCPLGDSLGAALPGPLGVALGAAECEGAGELGCGLDEGPVPADWLGAGVPGPALGVPDGATLLPLGAGTTTGAPGSPAGAGVAPGGSAPTAGLVPGDAPSMLNVPPRSPRWPPWWADVPCPAFALAVPVPDGRASTGPSGVCAPTDMQPLIPSAASVASTAPVVIRRRADPTAITEPPSARPTVFGAQRSAVPPGHG
ncbi:hypothetical protein AB0K51_19440 [Kitasatospora sp. NPDC049285]|uniref:hypothetical protein n=1 Tax=Kitasatospora sp. NPDC049285 TaxID=3157096 RepID=UPI0034453A70